MSPTLRERFFTPITWVVLAPVASCTIKSILAHSKLEINLHFRRRIFINDRMLRSRLILLLQLQEIEHLFAWRWFFGWSSFDESNTRFCFFFFGFSNLLFKSEMMFKMMRACMGIRGACILCRNDGWQHTWEQPSWFFSRSFSKRDHWTWCLFSFEQRS